MILDKNMNISERFSRNLVFYNSQINNKSEKEIFSNSIFIIEEVIDKLLEHKLRQVSKVAKVPDMSYNSKIDLCYKMELMKGDLREMLQTFYQINKDFSKPNSQEFADLEVQTNILKLCRLNENDIFTFVINLINQDSKITKPYEKVEDFIVDIGWSGTFKFLCSIIYASLVEALVELKQ